MEETCAHGDEAPGWYWFPLLVFGGLAALSLPLSRLGSPPVWAMLAAILTPAGSGRSVLSD